MIEIHKRKTVCEENISRYGTRNLEIEKIASEVLKEISLSCSNDGWEFGNSAWRTIKNLEVDKRGAWGHATIKKVLNSTSLFNNVEGGVDETRPGGDLFLTFKDIIKEVQKLEQKTATLGCKKDNQYEVDRTFQVENINSGEGFDYMSFLFVTPENLFWVVVSVGELKSEQDFTISKRGYRKTNKDINYQNSCGKITTRLEKVWGLVQNGKCIILNKSSQEEINNFVKERFNIL